MATRGNSRFFILFIGVFFLLGLNHASALTLSFNNITANSVGDAAIGEAQLSVDVTDISGLENLLATQAVFTFRNTGSADSSIADVYFDDGINDPAILLSLASITDSGLGVSFSENASPGNLPGGNAPLYAFSSDFDADSDAPVQHNGVNPGEWLALTFDLVAGVTLGDLFDDLGEPNPDLRVGIHVQGFSSGGSESFINSPPGSGGGGGGNPVPEPGTMLLLGFGLIGLAGVTRKKKLQK